MTTFVDFERGNFNGDNVSVGDLLFFKDDGAKAVWLENGAGGRLATSPVGFNLPFTGPTLHIVGAADFDASTVLGHFITGPGTSNPGFASDLLFQNDNGALALWQSNGSNVNSFPGNENQVNLPNPGNFHVASVNDF